MKDNIEKYTKLVEELIRKGDNLFNSMQNELFPEEFLSELEKGLADEKKIKDFLAGLPDFQVDYHSWYNESLEVIKILIPERLEDFKKFYSNPKRKSASYETYTIEDYMQSLTVTRGLETVVDSTAAVKKFQQQLSIVKSAKDRINSELFNIRQLLQASLFDSELDSSRELLKNGYLRAAGVVAGVVLESHLSELFASHGLTSQKKIKTIAIYNDLLKDASVYDVTTWRKVQYLGDIRNLCGHKSKTEPSKDDVQDMINGVDKFIKNVH